MEDRHGRRGVDTLLDCGVRLDAQKGGTVNPEERRRTRFDPRDLESSVIAFPLLKRMQQNPSGVHRVLIALHNGYGDPESAARKVRKIVDEVFADEKQDGEAVVTRELSQYVV